MIGRLAGRLLEKNPPWILIDVQGVGYDVQLPMSSFFLLPNIGEPLQVLTQFVVREDAQQLYGFLTHAEREAFRQLIKIGGVGARTALAVLSGLSVDELRQAVVLQEAGRLTRVPGIGKKTAERMLLELKGKLGDALPSAPGGALVTADDHTVQIVQALVALGYSDKEAAMASRGLPAAITVDEGLRMALKALMKS
ncbi:MAG: Holliday junction branch migration protein RuvA [Burkholderiaceae bacterium]|jgi:Holliday junction DNA helicase RuvA